MEQTVNNIQYILESKKNIDQFLAAHEYKKAFRLLILVLERLDEDEKKELIEYYYKKMIRNT